MDGVGLKKESTDLSRVLSGREAKRKMAIQDLKVSFPFDDQPRSFRDRKFRFRCLRLLALETARRFARSVMLSKVTRTRHCEKLIF